MLVLRSSAAVSMLSDASFILALLFLGFSDAVSRLSRLFTYAILGFVNPVVR